MDLFSSFMRMTDLSVNLFWRTLLFYIFVRFQWFFTSTFFFRIRQKCNLGSRNFRLPIAQCYLAYCYACWFVRLSFSSKIEIKLKQIDLRLMCSFSILFLASRTFICICPRLNALVLHSTREAKRSSVSSIIKCTFMYSAPAQNVTLCFTW